ncbi:MAG: hypothetical protein ABI828_03670 [Actinomycetota bacterium]
MTWCGQCFATIPLAEPTTVTGLEARLRPQAAPVAEVTEPQRFSRWGSSATSFGPVGRILLTLGLIVGLLIGFPLSYGGVSMVVGDIPSKGYLAIYLLVAVPGGLWCATRIWRAVRVA